jgi:CheY-like chemotaxis protein
MEIATMVGTRILVVEDEAMVSMMVEDFLEGQGCVVVATASRLAEAVEKATRESLDVALLDVNLAGQMSYPVADVLTARNIPFLFVTGYGRTGLPDRLREAQVLTKPYRMEQLADALMVAIHKQYIRA